MIGDLIDVNSQRSRGVEKNGELSRREKGWALIKSIPGRVRRFFSKETIIKMEKDGKLLLSLLSFLGLVILFLLELVWKLVKSIKGTGRFTSGAETFWRGSAGRLAEGAVRVLENHSGGVRRSFLIGLAFRNMKVKKMRSVVTVGGVSLGIAAIVFLVSLGYGVQQLVVSRVARLQDLKMADVLIGKSAVIRLDEAAMATIGRVPEVEKVLPVVSMVGRVETGGAVSEAVTYAVTSDYLETANLRLIHGDFYKTEPYAFNQADSRVAGVATEWKVETGNYGELIRKVEFNIEEESWLKVRREPNTKGEILGFVKRVEGGFEGTEVWGGEYQADDGAGHLARNDDGDYLGVWIKAPYPLWKPVEGKLKEYEMVMDQGVQDWREGYIASIDVTIDEEGSEALEQGIGLVLGESTASAELTSELVPAVDASTTATVVGTDDNGVEWVELGEAAAASEKNKIILPFAKEAVKVAVVNAAFAETIGIDPGKAAGQVFKVSFLVSQILKSDIDRPAESEAAEYKIVGVVEGGSSPVMYVPFKDITGLGVNNYSQAKIMVGDKMDLAKVREQIDNMGYSTSSVADTVAQIDKLFGTVRLILASFGMVALAVASLGMFNTMTVSLMERTHEVGVMKAMGMRSNEVRELFLAEAMVMGILGGFFGVSMGILLGKLLGVLLSVVSLAKGVGLINISYVPFGFVAFIIILSFVVGVITGVYPARRATRISALDALRYE